MTDKRLDRKGYYHVTDDEEFVLSPKEYFLRLQCCNCGLVHRVDFSKQRNGVRFKFKVDKRATTAVRRKKR